MTGLADLFASGWISVFAIAVLWVETALLVRMRPAARNLRRSLVPNALAGTMLLVCLGLAQRDAHPLVIALTLAGALGAHVWDVSRRLGDAGRKLTRPD